MDKIPQALEAEELVLGSILLAPESIHKIPDLKPQHFSLKRHQAIYAECLYLADRDNLDMVTLSQRLEDTGNLDKIGGMTTLTNLLGNTVSSINIDRFASLILDKYRRRKLIENAHKLVELGRSEYRDFSEIIMEAEGLLTEALTNDSAKGLIQAEELIPQTYEEIFNRRDDAIPTNLNQLDHYLNGGFRPKELVVIAGRAAMGKSFVGNYIAETIARTGKPVAIFSAEMDNITIMKRFLGKLSHLEISKLISNRVSQGNEADALFEGMEELSKLPIYSDDTAGSRITIPYLFSECNKLKRKHGELGAVVVDYLQLLGDRTASNRAADIGKYSAGLKDLSKQLDTRVIALAQINREVEGMNNKRPHMAHIKDSGSIEQDADIIITLYREEYYNPDTPDRGILELNIVKNRNGQTGLVKVCFDPTYGKITNLRNFVEEY